MPTTKVIFYSEADGRSPIVEWFADLRRRDGKAWANCVARVEQLQQAGHQLRRPTADYLRDGIYELRARKGHAQYRILYFFHGNVAAVLAHGMIKQGSAVPDIDIERALKRKKNFERNPRMHTHEQ